MEDDIDMNNHKLVNLLDPTNENDSVNKKYVDSELAKLPQHQQLNGVLFLDGSKAMTGDLNMDDHKIINLKDPENDNDAVNKTYFENNLPNEEIVYFDKLNLYKNDKILPLQTFLLRQYFTTKKTVFLQIQDHMHLLILNAV